MNRSILVIALLAFGLTACGEKPAAAPAAAPASVSVAPEAPKTEAAAPAADAPKTEAAADAATEKTGEMKDKTIEVAGAKDVIKK